MPIAFTAATAILQAGRDYLQDQAIEKLRALLEIQIARVKELLEALKVELLQRIFKSRLDEAEGFILTAQDDLDLAQSRSDSSALDILDDARDNALHALNSYALTLQELKATSIQAQTAEDGAYTDAVGAAFPNAVDACVLHSAILTKLQTLGWPDCAPEVIRTYSFLMELADMALVTLRNLNDHHFTFKQAQHKDGNLTINSYGYWFDGKLTWVSEGIAGKNNSAAMKEARDEMTSAADRRYSSLPVVEAILALVQEIEPVLDRLRENSRRSSSRATIAAIAVARSRVTAA